MSIKLTIEFDEHCKAVSFNQLTKSLFQAVRDGVRQELERALSVGTFSPQPAKDPDQTHPVALSKARAARALGVSVRTIDNCIAQKRIRVLRIGRRVLVPMTSIDAALKRGALDIQHGHPPAAQREALRET